MGSWTGFLLTYLFGGVTFVPLVIVVVLLHAHLTFPVRDDVDRKPENAADSIVQPGDDTTPLRAAQKAQKEDVKVQPEAPEVAAGYFAVCREYTPSGINAKPIERSTPVGSTTVAPPSQSVYQVMYRSIFDRKQSPAPGEHNPGVSQRPKKAGNVFYVVLRHGHLMLFDDEEQLEVRHVISLAHHNVSIYSGGDKIPEGELFIKRNAILLSRKITADGGTPDMQMSKPFYLFSEDCSAKEDFYFALLRNQEQGIGASEKGPQPQQFEVKNIISLVQKLHSSEENMHTRWLNALLGRIFLGVYKTRDLENYIREKLTKKISRVKRPSFLSKIRIQKIDTGSAAPFITNPRLKDLNVEGDFVMEADVRYTGNFRLEVAAAARIDLGSRFKAREVNLVLAVVLKKLEGHVYFRIKPPPSNRIWFSFQTMPKMEMTIEPIVSSRQITYTVILRQIENRIKEVVAETLVQPFWDDTPFFKTDHKRWRGGIFEDDDAVVHSEDHGAMAAALGDVDEVSQIEETNVEAPEPSLELPPAEKSQSVQVLESPNNHPQSPSFWSRKKKPVPINLSESASASTTTLETKALRSASTEPPRPIRSGSFSAASPTISTDPTNVESFKPSSTPPNHEDATSAIAHVFAKSQRISPAETPIDLPARPLSVAKTPDRPSFNEALSTELENGQSLSTGRRNTASSIDSVHSHSSASSRKGVRRHDSARSFFGRKENSSSTSVAASHGPQEPKRNTLTAMSNVANNAAGTVKRWGLNAFQRQSPKPDGSNPPESPGFDLKQPMGRGQPLPPPGTPLPGPEKGSRFTPIALPKRKPLPPPRPTHQSTSDLEETKIHRRPVPLPPLPARRRRATESYQDESEEDNVLVVEAPQDSLPSTPLHENHDDDEHPGYIQPWVEDAEDEATPESSDNSTPAEPVVEELILQKPAPARLQPELPPREQPSPSNGSVHLQPSPKYEDDDFSNWMDNVEAEHGESDPGVTKARDHSD